MQPEYGSCSGSEDSESGESADEFCEVEVVEDGEREMVLVPQNQVSTAIATSL